MDWIVLYCIVFRLQVQALQQYTEGVHKCSKEKLTLNQKKKTEKQKKEKQEKQEKRKKKTYLQQRKAPKPKCHYPLHQPRSKGFQQHRMVSIETLFPTLQERQSCQLIQTVPRRNYCKNQFRRTCRFYTYVSIVYVARLVMKLASFFVLCFCSLFLLKCLFALTVHKTQKVLKCK